MNGLEKNYFKEHSPQSVAVYDRNGRLLRLTLASDERYRLWLPLAEMSPVLVDAVLLHEDAWFRWHPGFHPISLTRGAWSTYVSGDARVGGSTLTMQLARLLGRLDTRSPRGKLVQIGHALLLEARYSKDEILEAYRLLAGREGLFVEPASAASDGGAVEEGSRGGHPWWPGRRDPHGERPVQSSAYCKQKGLPKK